MHSTESAHRIHKHVHRKIPKVQCIETSEYQMNVCFRGTEYVRLRQRSWGKFFISRDVLGKRAGGKNRRWGKFLEITEHSAPLVCLMSLF